MFKWSDGSAWDYGNWQHGQPERSDERQLYVVMNTRGRWHDTVDISGHMMSAMCQSKPEIYQKGN